ncbi:MAG TPA: 3-oxoadipate enol-lactonase [Pseudolabrys sp.]|nr:3-oxoadipate enol-lactonase [Pseudolabrys sp.]
MPTITVDDGCPIHVEVTGPENAPALMLSNSLGTNLHMWDDQADAFAKRFRLIRYDRRGHGQSGAPKGPYSFDRFGRDILGVLDVLGIKKTNWCGLSMGGMDGQWLGANAPNRVEKLVLANTNFYYADKAPWADRIRFVREKGLEALVAPNMERWFTKGFRDRAPEAIARMTKMFVASDREGYIGCVEAIRDMDFRASNPTIKAPTLVIVGAQDPATPPVAGETIAKATPGAKLVSLDAAHISNVEQPQAFTKAVLDFLT